MLLKWMNLRNYYLWMKVFKKYKILQLAVQDFSEAKKWYANLKVNGLSNRFSAEVKSAIKNILSNPYANAIRYREVRITHTKKFPYAIHYFIEEDTIVIIAIIYDRRDPSLTLKR
jgi:plasmid stabilization system protein ParE